MKGKLALICLLIGSNCVLTTHATTVTQTTTVTATKSTTEANTKPAKPAPTLIKEIQKPAATATFQIAKGSTLMFNIQKLSDMYGWDAIIEGKDDIEIMRTTSIDLTNYQDSLTALIKNYPVHVDLYEANHVAVISLTQN